jgi:hypothetical protein
VFAVIVLRLPVDKPLTSPVEAELHHSSFLQQVAVLQLNAYVAVATITGVVILEYPIRSIFQHPVRGLDHLVGTVVIPIVLHPSSVSPLPWPSRCRTRAFILFRRDPLGHAGDHAHG